MVQRTTEQPITAFHFLRLQIASCTPLAGRRGRWAGGPEEEEEGTSARLEGGWMLALLGHWLFHSVLEVTMQSEFLFANTFYFQGMRT